jgi:thioredoxin reductase
VNYLHDIAAETIVGRGAAGYTAALDFVASRTGRGPDLADAPKPGDTPPESGAH